MKYLVDTNSKETYNLGSGPNFIGKGGRGMYGVCPYI